jgi:hypothetical protein
MNYGKDSVLYANASGKFEAGNLKLIIGGFPRSGTTWIANVFNELGVQTGHEAPLTKNGFRPHKKSKDNVVCSTGFINAHRYEIEAAGVPIIQVIRDPIGVQQSFLNRFPSEFDTRDDVEQITYRWWQWNTELEQVADNVISLNRMSPGVFQLILSNYLGVKVPIREISRAYNSVDRNRSNGKLMYEYSIRDFVWKYWMEILDRMDSVEKLKGPCRKCDGHGWVWGRELDNPDWDTIADTMTKYSCDGCEEED